MWEPLTGKLWISWAPKCQIFHGQSLKIEICYIIKASEPYWCAKAWVTKSGRPHRDAGPAATLDPLLELGPILSGPLLWATSEVGWSVAYILELELGSLLVLAVLMVPFTSRCKVVEQGKTDHPWTEAHMRVQCELSKLVIHSRIVHGTHSYRWLLLIFSLKDEPSIVKFS